jgi:hypothetical protein
MSKPEDPIVDLKTYSRDVNTLFAVTLKKSGTFDFYMNGAKLFTSSSASSGASRIVFKRIGITADRIYV